ncbi:hypothetical protein BGZ98_008750 [Dissophora globulifera]|nr:hypothetical protein BGZ98_008750 [Dissophora globulifera]
MATSQGLPTGPTELRRETAQPLEDMPSPIIASEGDFDSSEDHHHATRSTSPNPPLRPAAALSVNPPTGVFEVPNPAQQSFNHHGSTIHQGLPIPAPLKRNNSSNFMPFNEIPSLPAFLSNCNLSQYLQSFNDAGAADDSMPLIIEFDDNELKDIMDAIPMKPFHAVTFRRGIRNLRERSQTGSMHFDNSQNSFMQQEPHSMLHYSHSQFFQQPSQPSQHSQTSHPSQSSLSSSQPTRGYTFQSGSSQTPGLYHQSSGLKSHSQRQSSQGNSTSQPQPYGPTPAQVLSGGGIYQYVGPAPRASGGSNYYPQPSSGASQNDIRQIKRRRSSSTTPLDMAVEGSSPVLPEPNSFNSNSPSSWDSNTPQTSTAPSQPSDPATKELIMHQALIFGKHRSRSLTKYEHAINCAAQILALEDPSLLTNKGLLWTKAKAKLLEENYDYKRGRSRSKLPEAQQKKDVKMNRERLIQKRETNASNVAAARLHKIAQLGEQLHRKTAEREDLLALLLRLESPDHKQTHPTSYELEAKHARENLERVEKDRLDISSQLGSLKNKERKHQWYEKRKHRAGNGERSEQDDKNANASSDAEADEEAETDTTVDPDGDASQKSLSIKLGGACVGTLAPVPETMKMESAAAVKSAAWKDQGATLAAAAMATATGGMSKAPLVAKSKKRKEIFRASEFSSKS